MDEPSSPFFSVIIPCLNGGSAFEACLAALERSSFTSWELIVVDDGSTDDSPAIAEQARATLLHTPGRVGPGAARNRGAKEARGQFLLFIDADCEVAPKTLERAAAILRADDSIDALFGSYDDEPVSKRWVSQYKNLQHHFVHQQGCAEASTFWAGCGAIRRSNFLEIDGFDVERYPRPSIEDIELGYRLRSKGFRIRLAKDVQVKHHKDWRLGQLLKTDLFDRGIPWTLLLLERKGIINDLNLDLKGRASVLLTGLLFPVLALVALHWSLAFVTGAAVVSGLLLLNHRFYRFLASRNGLSFAIACIPLHWIYFFICGLAFVGGQLSFRLGKK